jgi:hypothetical protein
MPATGVENYATSVKPPEPVFNGENLAVRNKRDDLLDEKGRSRSLGMKDSASTR